MSLIPVFPLFLILLALRPSSATRPKRPGKGVFLLSALCGCCQERSAPKGDNRFALDLSATSVSTSLGVQMCINITF